MVSSGCNSFFVARETDGLIAWVAAVGFDHPMPWAATNTPLAQALWLLLWLHSQIVGGSAGSDIYDDMILIMLESRLSSRTSAFVNEVRGSIAYWSSSALSTNWQGSPKSEEPVVWNSCQSLLGHGSSPWVAGMMPRLFSQTPGCHSGQGPQRALATMLGCQVASHTM